MKDSNQTLIIDFSLEKILVSINSVVHKTQVSTEDFFKKPKQAHQDLKQELKSYGIGSVKVIFSLPIRYITYQVIPLPDEAPQDEKLKLMSIDLDRANFLDLFSCERLSVTERMVAGERICDYLLVAPQKAVRLNCQSFLQKMNSKLYKFVANYNLFKPERDAEIISAFAHSSNMEIVFWSYSFPIAISNLSSTNEPANDLNRFLDIYQNDLENKSLSIENIDIYGTNLGEYSFSNLTHKLTLREDYESFLMENLPSVASFQDITKKVKLPPEPFRLDFPNLAHLFAVMFLVFSLLLGLFATLQNMSLDQKYLVFQNEVTQYERQIAEKKRIKQEITDLEKEREFYYSITRRRAPWDLILKELSKLTPKGLWIERFSAAKNNLVMIGKAEKVNEVSGFAVNLSHSSKYFSDVLLSGSRDYSDGLVYKEFQITARLKAPETAPLPTN